MIIKNFKKKIKQSFCAHSKSELISRIQINNNDVHTYHCLECDKIYEFIPIVDGR